MEEGVAGYVYDRERRGTVPFYRLWSPKNTDHFYTTNKHERDYAIAHYGYVDEGVAGWVYQA